MNTGGMTHALRLAAERNWTEIPGIRVLGAVIGTLLLVAALRAMFGGRR